MSLTFFTKKNLKKIGDEIVYINEDRERKVIAVFKNNNSRANKFMRFIRENVTVEKYLQELEEGASPSEIARDRGFY